MSNESENRIDLTQFEKLPKKMEITWHEHPIYGARYLVQISGRETPWTVGTIASDYEPYGVYDKDKIEQERMAKMFAATPDLIAELKKCYEELDSLPTRWQMSEIHNYTKWLETVESYFLADGSFNQDPAFVRKCAVNNKYGYRIEVIDGVETVVHESG
jgi:hypothetical protein